MTEIETGAEAVCLVGVVLSVTVTVPEYVPELVGVPVIAPVVPLMFNPGGSPLATHVNGGVPPLLVQEAE